MKAMKVLMVMMIVIVAVFLFQNTQCNAYYNLTNYAYGTLASSINSGAGSGATFTVTSGVNSGIFSTSNFLITVIDANCFVPHNCPNREIILITSRSGNTFTIGSRNMEGTVFSGTWGVDSKVGQVVTAGTLQNIMTPDPDFVGTWAWQSIATAKKNSTGWLATPWGAVGTLTVNANGTASFYEVVKYDNGKYRDQTVTGCTWVQISAGVYRLTVGTDFFDFFISGDTGIFSLMSNTTDFNKGLIEHGVMFRNLNISTLITTYQGLITSYDLTESVYKGAIVSLTTPQSIPDGTETTVSWDKVIENGGCWSIAHPTRLTVPTGVSAVRLSANSYWAEDNTGTRGMGIRKNGVTATESMPADLRAASFGTPANIVSPVYTVVPGDYFELYVAQSSGGALNFGYLNYETWFSMEIIY